MIIPYRANAEWEQWVLLTSDRHFDSPYSDHELQREHLEEAIRRNAPVIDCGDMLDAMGGKTDRRGHKEGIRPEHMVDNYFDAILESAVDFFLPYKKQLAIFGEGNHETAITKHHEINLTDRFCSLINSEGGSVFKAGYGFHVAFSFDRDGKGSHITRLDARFVHGSGGGGVVTKGMIAAQRRAVIYRTDIVVSGHIHECFTTHFPQTSLSPAFAVVVNDQLHIQLPTYKNEYDDGSAGYHNENERAPRPIGAMWLRFYWCRRTQKVRAMAIRAQ